MKMKYVVSAILLGTSLVVQASGQPTGTPGQNLGQAKQAEAKALAAEKKAAADAAHARHVARIEEEKADGKTSPPLHRRFSLQ